MNMCLYRVVQPPLVRSAVTLREYGDNRGTSEAAAHRRSRTPTVPRDEQPGAQRRPPAGDRSTPPDLAPPPGDSAPPRSAEHETTTEDEACSGSGCSDDPPLPADTQSPEPSFSWSPPLTWILRAFEGVAACEIAKVPVLQGQ